MRSGQKAGGGLRFEVSGHDIWGKRTSTHPEDILQSGQSHLNWFWKNRDMKLTILGIFWPKKGCQKSSFYAYYRAFDGIYSGNNLHGMCVQSSE